MSTADPSLGGRLHKTVVTDVHVPGLAENCQAWRGSHDRAGHARIKTYGKNRHVRRLVLECDGEPMTKADQVIALCGHVWCVNRVHLLRATAEERRAFGLHGRLGLGDIWIASRLLAEGSASADELARHWEISSRFLCEAVERIA